MWLGRSIMSAAIAIAGSAAWADTTDREHETAGIRDDDAHLAAWQSLLDEQETASRGGGGIFRRATCGAADFNKPECKIENDNDDGGGHGH